MTAAMQPHNSTQKQTTKHLQITLAAPKEGQPPYSGQNSYPPTKPLTLDIDFIDMLHVYNIYALEKEAP